MKSLSRGPEWRWLVILAAIALVVRLGWALLMMDRTPQFDEIEYIDLAARLAAGEGYVDESGARVAYWPVGYPALLSLVFRLTGGLHPRQRLLCRSLSELRRVFFFPRWEVVFFPLVPAVSRAS